jgi:hypothetical protein
MLLQLVKYNKEKMKTAPTPIKQAEIFKMKESKRKR